MIINIRLFQSGLFASIFYLALTCTLRATDNSLPGEQNILRATLTNGLQVIIVRNTLAPVITTTVNYRVGSDETCPAFPGSAHATEHMMFRGSPRMSADQLAAISAAFGGDFNADTQQAVTQYFLQRPLKTWKLCYTLKPRG